MKITFITVSAPAVKSLIIAEKQISSVSPDSLDLAIYYAVSEFGQSKNAQMINDIAKSDFVFVDLMGSPPGVCKAVNEGLDRCMGNIFPYGSGAREYMRLGALTAENMKNSTGMGKKSDAMGNKGKPDMMPSSGRLGMAMSAQKPAMGAMGTKPMPPHMRDMRNFGQLMKYFKTGNEYNLYNMLLFILNEYADDKRAGMAGAPQEVQPLYVGEHDFSDGRPVIALLHYGHQYPTDTSGCVAAIREKLSRVGNVLSIAVSGTTPEVLSEMRTVLLEAKPDAVINFMSFRLGAGPMGGDVDFGTKLLADLGAPYLHPFFVTRRTVSDWQTSVQGCTTSETMISLLLPELDGCIDTIPIGAMSEPTPDNRYDTYTEELELIEERADRLCEMTARQIALRKKPNSEKRVALICYNYPPGEDNLFGGAFMDTFASIEKITAYLHAEGYNTEALTKEKLMQRFCAGKAVNSGRYRSGTDGMILYDVKKYKSSLEMEETWQKAPGNIMAEGRHFLIPGMISGNVFIGLQPARGTGDEDITSYHDKTVPSHHQYAAFYQWLREEFRADAIIHVGTHGTLEFLKGKEAGMSGDCYPDKLIGGIPHIYLYYCGNPAESTIAKRRSHAVIVSYQPPVFVESGLYGTIEELSGEMDNYHHALSLAPQSAEEIRLRIKTLAEAVNLPSEPEELENELYRMRHSLIPKGLHTFGEPYSDEEIESYLSGLKNYASAKDADLEKIRTDAAQCRELEGLRDALAGRYVPAKMAGDIYRTPAVLPSGYNLYQFDPKLIPTATAYERGKRIAENTIQEYLKETGKYPSSVAVVLWGLETSRTQGETFAQILAYLGIRPVQSSPFEKKYEIIPLSELGRPRIDVTVNIWGFFRDMFPNLIEILCDLFERVSALEEAEEDNLFKAHSNAYRKQLLSNGYDAAEAEILSVSRVFGPPAGEYGSGITKLFEEHNWDNETQLGQVFTDRLCHVYNRSMHGRRSDGLYEDNLRAVDIVSQLRNSNEYELTDLDHYFEFFGGLSKSVENVKGIKAKMYVTDTSGENLYTETVDKSIARGIRTRVLNPKWIDGMLAHDYHGAQQIADRFENVMGLAATTGSVDAWIYDELDKKYVEDEEIRRRMIENNPHAYMKILEQLMEYSDRGYWNASEEQLETIRNTYLVLENDIEGTL